MANKTGVAEAPTDHRKWKYDLMKYGGSEELLLGDEAIARAAIDAGISGACGYPGTPSTEIMDFVMGHAQEGNHVKARWSANEKVAMEEALGLSYVGKRVLVTMKHVGLNVAADAVMNAAMTGVVGGLVIAVADDPGMHSSQNEQDSRYYAEFAKLPCLEPKHQQACYDMTREAFLLSERLELPVFVRVVTRIAHSRSTVTRRPADVVLPSGVEDYRLDRVRANRWTLVPSNARRQFQILLDKQPHLLAHSESRTLAMNAGPTPSGSARGKVGIVCASSGAGYLEEALSISGVTLPILEIGYYPLPVAAIREFVKGFETVVVVEDGYPFIEERLLGVAGKGPAVRGRRDGTWPAAGELDTDKIRSGLSQVVRGMKPGGATVFQPEGLPPRPPMLCPGCPHIDLYKALNEAMEGRRPGNIFSDIGCYTLGVLPPHGGINSCVEMGASIGMAMGASEGGLTYAVALLGDSTFAHSGLPGLRVAAFHNIPMTVIIADNGVVAMTGGQNSYATGDALPEMVKGLGVAPDHVRVMTPLPAYHAANVEMLKRELDYRGCSVVISSRPCVQIAKRRVVP